PNQAPRPRPARASDLCRIRSRGPRPRAISAESSPPGPAVACPISAESSPRRPVAGARSLPNQEGGPCGLRLTPMAAEIQATAPWLRRQRIVAESGWRPLAAPLIRQRSCGRWGGPAEGAGGARGRAEGGGRVGGVGLDSAEIETGGRGRWI